MLLRHTHPPSHHRQYNSQRKCPSPNDRADVLSTSMARRPRLGLAKFGQRQGEFSCSLCHDIALDFVLSTEYPCWDIKCNNSSSVSLWNARRTTATLRVVPVCIPSTALVVSSTIFYSRWISEYSDSATCGCSYSWDGSIRRSSVNRRWWRKRPAPVMGYTQGPRATLPSFGGRSGAIQKTNYCICKGRFWHISIFFLVEITHACNL